MSVHPSLRGDKAAASLRNVWKRHERVRYLIAHGLWPEGRSVFGLPKIKQAKVKAKKAAAKDTKEEGATGAGAAEPTPPPAGS